MMNEWHDMDEAPLDRRVIVRIGTYVTIARWVPKFDPVYGDTGEGWYSGDGDKRVFPDAWMELPTLGEE